MARAGMALHRRGTTNHGNIDGADDVQRSIELLDRVLSEFDDVENANQIQNVSAHVNPSCNEPGNVSSTPDDESPSLGHQSEDDGYMSMNGRKAKFSLAFKPLTEVPAHQENSMPPGDLNDFPPPPEEAERLISTLLPKVSPIKKIGSNPRAFPLTQIFPRDENTIPPPQSFQNSKIASSDSSTSSESKHIATQTTLPKTRHQRPYGWERANYSSRSPQPAPTGCRYGSLPFSHGVYAVSSPTRVPPRTVPTAIERHREVRRHGSEDNLSSDLDESALRPLSELADDERFSDDSLEETLPPPPTYTNKRSSIAWEVPLDDESLMTPGSTKVVGRRRRKSGSHSSTSSIPSRLKELDDWPDPPPYSTEEEMASPFSDSDDHIVLPPELNSANISGTSTYIIRRGKNDRKSLNNVNGSLNSNSSLNSRLSSDLSIPASRFSVDLNARLSRELNTPNSRYSIDLSTPHSRLSSPKSRLSLDLNNSRPPSQEYTSSSSRLSAEPPNSRSSTPLSRHGSDFKKHSTTFDNIKSFIKESTVETCTEPTVETTSEFLSPTSPIVRVVSLPSLNAEESTPKRELAVTVEEEEDVESPNKSSTEVSPLRKIEQNISELLERRDIQVSSIVQNDKYIIQLNGVPGDKKSIDSLRRTNDNQNHNNYNEEYYRKLLIESGNVQHYPKRSIQKSESAKEMLIAHKEKTSYPLKNSSSVDFSPRTDSFQHDFPPLPPSPVEEDDDEYSEIVQPFKNKQKSETLPSTSEAPAVPPHRDQSSNSLKTRSMDAGFSRGRRNYSSNTSNRNFLPERRTLPTEMQGTKRKTYQKRSSHSPQEEHHLQTSCSLPETPIFARGCDIPRTPHRKAPDIPPHSGRLAPRQSSTMGSLSTIGNMSTGGYRRNSGLEQAIVGAELLRLAGGPGRGWYPKQRATRPASIEHLDRLAPGHNPWDSNRKPLTLPPNLTPKFFQRSPRDALRRVTSLLIKKGNAGKESKKEKDLTNMKLHESASVEEGQKKKGFFRSFWKKSRHYSLEENR